jgi:Histone acetyltransferase
MEEAERIAREEHGSIKLAVISGKFIASTMLCTITDRLA